MVEFDTPVAAVPTLVKELDQSTRCEPSLAPYGRRVALAWTGQDGDNKLNVAEYESSTLDAMAAYEDSASTGPSIASRLILQDPAQQRTAPAATHHRVGRYRWGRYPQCGDIPPAGLPPVAVTRSGDPPSPCSRIWLVPPPPPGNAGSGGAVSSWPLCASAPPVSGSAIVTVSRPVADPVGPAGRRAASSSRRFVVGSRRGSRSGRPGRPRYPAVQPLPEISGTRAEVMVSTGRYSPVH
jgi:hypothetical protein